MCACYAGHAAVTGAGGLRRHVDEGGAQVVAEVNDGAMADVYDAFGGEHDKLCKFTYMCTAPFHIAPDIHPTAKGYAVIASARKSAAEDTTADGESLCDVGRQDRVGPRTEGSVAVGHRFR
jgi:hypothetical protein